MRLRNGFHEIRQTDTEIGQGRVVFRCESGRSESRFAQQPPETVAPSGVVVAAGERLLTNGSSNKNDPQARDEVVRKHLGSLGAEVLDRPAELGDSTR